MLHIKTSEKSCERLQKLLFECGCRWPFNIAIYIIPKGITYIKVKDGGELVWGSDEKKATDIDATWMEE